MNLQFYVFVRWYLYSAFAVDNWMEEAPANFARRADITLTDPAESMSMLSGQV